MPVIANLNLKFHPLGQTEEPYEEKFILSIVYCYQQVIKETLKITDSGTELICCVLKAETIVEDNLIVCKIRLHFPYCKTLGQVQNRIIRPLVLQMVRTTNVFSYLASQPVNDWEDIIDPLSVERPILMYGSSSSSNEPKLILEYIFPQVNFDDIKDSKTAVMETSETFFFQNHEHMAGGIITPKMFEDEDNDDYWLPYFLSIYYLKEITLTKNIPPSSISASKKNVKNMKNSSFFEEEDKNGPEYLSTVFLGMLKIERAEEEHFWKDIGKGLYNCFEGSERGLEKWIDFTENSDIYNFEDCKREYYNFIDNKTSIRTLGFYAREDSPIEYKKWHEIWCLPYLERAASCSHSDVAEALSHIYWLEFACSNLKNNTLYFFKNHLWKRLDSGHILRNYISGDFLSKVEKFRSDIAMEIHESNDKNFKDSAENTIQKIGKLILKLKNRTFKNAVFAEACEQFYIEEFEEKLDTNPNLMGCLNGIIETLDKKAVFRDGKPEDYVSKSTGVFFHHNMNKKNPLYIKLISWLQKCFPDKELLNHFGKLMGASLSGKNSDKIFPIHTGCGNNSKSMIKKLIEATFGNYIITLTTGTFTNDRRGGGNADPSMARSKFAHFAFIQEPDSDKPLKSGILKEMTGGDKFFARFLHSNGSEIDPMFTLHMQCNTIPIIPQCDQAIKNRVRVLPYLSQWVKNPPKDPDDQFRERKFLMDPFFEKQIPEMAPAFLFHCIEMYAVYKREGLKDPPIVLQHTAAYWEDNDIYGQFVKENLQKAFKTVPSDWKGEKPLDEKATISLAEMYKRFKDWHKECFGNLRVPDRQIVRTEIESRVAKCKNRNFYGIKFIIPEIMMV